MSPAAVTMGDVTLSRSQLRRTLRVATPTVMPITTIDERKPPITEITTKSAIEMVFSSPNATEMALARIASTSDTDNDIEIDAARFWPTIVSRRADIRNVPVCTTVPRRLPSAPNTLPRMPIAAGTRTRRPGRDSSVPVMEPSVSPARRSPPELMSSATKPARTPEASERSSARSARRRLATTATLGLGGSFISSTPWTEEQGYRAFRIDDAGALGSTVRSDVQLSGSRVSAAGR